MESSQAFAWFRPRVPVYNICKNQRTRESYIIIYNIYNINTSEYKQRHGILIYSVSLLWCDVSIFVNRYTRSQPVELQLTLFWYKSFYFWNVNQNSMTHITTWSFCVFWILHLHSWSPWNMFICIYIHTVCFNFHLIFSLLNATHPSMNGYFQECPTVSSCQSSVMTWQGVHCLATR